MNPLDMPITQRKFFTRQEALADGYASRDITRMVRAKSWTRIRRGIYVATAVWNAADPLEQHRIRALAVLASLDPDVALSHISAVAFHGVDLWGERLDKVHVTRLDGDAGRAEGDVIHHEGFCLDSDVVEVAGIAVIRAERAVLEAASRMSADAGFVLIESGLRASAYTLEQICETYDLLQHWPFTHRLALPMQLADARSGSVGESLARWRFHQWRLPDPDLQYEVRRPDGTIAGVADWAWPEHRVLAEFDGRVKYGRLLKPGQEPGDIVFAEKRREDELRELTGFTVVRMVWDDLRGGSTLQQRLSAALRRAA
jgi:hypothetical protein